MKTLNIVMDTIVVICFIGGMIATLTGSMGIGWLLWAFPAGWGAGGAIAEIVESIKKK